MEQPPAARTLPHSVEAEKSVLGSMLMDRNALELALEALNKHDFYLPAHQDIFEAAIGLYNGNSSVDSVTLISALQRSGRLENVGGAAYITGLAAFMPSAANCSHYIAIVEENSIFRQLIRAGGEIANDGLNREKPLEQQLNDAERRIFDISMKKGGDTLLPIQDVVFASYNRIGEIANLKGALTGVPTGFADLDKLTSGMQKSDLIIIAARPSMGKTSLAMNIAANASIRYGKTTVIFSLEMSREQLVMRMLCSEAQVGMQKVKTGQVTENDYLRFVEALDPLAKAKIFIDDTAGASVPEIRSKCRRLKAQHGLDMIVIDYLQLMQATKKSDSRVQEVSEITRAMKILARELNVPILLLSQLSRGPEQRKEHRPIMADLRESGAIEQDADIIMMIYRPAVYGESDDNVTEIILAKHRNGPTATVELAWLDEYTKFCDLAKDY